MAAANNNTSDRLFKVHGRWRFDNSKDRYVRDYTPSFESHSQPRTINTLISHTGSMSLKFVQGTQ